MESEGETPQGQPGQLQVSPPSTSPPSLNLSSLPQPLNHLLPPSTPPPSINPSSLPQLLPPSTPPPFLNLSSLPQPLLPIRYLVGFLSEFAQYSESTKMNAGNIAIVFGPNLLWSETDSSDAAYVIALLTFCTVCNDVTP